MTGKISGFRLFRGSCATIALALGTHAVAQETPSGAAPADAGDADEIVVTGFRASLDRAIAIKRTSDTIVDSITAEDVGKFPDTNIAESLQRISGVSIDRSGGEGQFVTVRGFGPKFNTVLVNGRTLGSENPGREFSFDLLAADLLAGADVYKSSSAMFQDGGLGATVNLRTARPFDRPGQRFGATAQVDYERLSKEFGGQAFALYSNTFADDNFGVLVSVSYQKRNADVNTIATNGYYTPTNFPAALGVAPGTFFPQNYDQIADTQERERLGVTGTLQGRLGDDFVVTLDGLYNKFTVESQANSIGHFFSPSEVTAVTVDANRTVTAFSQGPNGKTDYINRTFNRPTKLVATGLNLEWKPSDLVTVAFDSSYSRAESNNGGNEIFAVIGFSNPVTFSNPGTGVPSITAVNGFTDPTVGRAHFATREGFDRSEDIYEQRLDATFAPSSGFIKALKIGGYFQDLTKKNTLIRSEGNVGCAYCGYAIPVAAGLLKPFNPGNFFNNQSGNFPRSWLAYNAEDYFTFLESTAAANAQDAAVGRPVGTLAAFLAANNGYDPIVYPDGFKIRERIFGGYLQANFEGDLGGMTLSGNAGVRYTRTSVRSVGAQQLLLDLLAVPGDPTAYTSVTSPTAVPVTRTSSYDNFLPSLNLKLAVTPTLDLRFGASQTVTRPDITLLAPRVSYNNLRPGNLTASGGNPDLKPYKSTNFDLTAEWYFQPGSFVTVSGFYKRVKDFIVSGVATETFPIANASSLPEFAGGQAAFRVSRPRNIASIDVYGLELSAQHTFTYLPAPFDGLGVIANATIVGSSQDDGGPGSPQFGLEGLGNSQNATLFYESGPVQARVSYNRREKFLQTVADGNGQPVFVLPETHIDAQASFAVTDYATIFVEGVNLTNQKTRKQGQFSNQFIQLVETGPRYSAGFRVNF